MMAETQMVDLDLRKEPARRDSKLPDEEVEKLNKMVHFNLRISSDPNGKCQMLEKEQENSKSSGGSGSFNALSDLAKN